MAQQMKAWAVYYKNDLLEIVYARTKAGALREISPSWRKKFPKGLRVE